MHLYCYHVPPIDFWTGAMDMEQMREQCLDGDEWSALSVRLDALLKSAMAAFVRLGWEGDISGGPYFFALPDDVEMRLGCIIKQSNNGSCFVASPFPLAHLAKQNVESIVVR